MVESCQDNPFTVLHRQKKKQLTWWCSRTVEKVILSSWLPFLGSLLLVHFAWQSTATNNFLGGFSILPGGF